MATQTAPLVHLSGDYRDVLKLAFPVVLSMVSQTLMSAVDIAMLGHFGTVEQGAAGLGMALLWPFLLSCNCSGVGVNIFVAQYVGAQRRRLATGVGVPDLAEPRVRGAQRVQFRFRPVGRAVIDVEHLEAAACEGRGDFRDQRRDVAGLVPDRNDHRHRGRMGGHVAHAACF